jgi:hypothetical protein
MTGYLRSATTAALLALLPAAFPAQAQVVVEVVGDTAYADITLADATGTYQADVTIAFDTPANLTPASLGLDAVLVDPSDPALAARLPAGLAIDPDFPLLLTVEPPDLPWVFSSGFEGNALAGALLFHNTYLIEIHTHDLVYTPRSPYRVLKAPLGGPFADVTEDVRSGSTRARGRGGAFSQFVVARDTRLPWAVALEKVVALDLRLLSAVLTDTLRLDLLALLADVQVALLVPLVGCNNALAPLDDFIGEVQANAGINIANTWRAGHDLVNDAGELESLAATLRFSLLGCAR